MLQPMQSTSAVTAPTQFVDSNGRRLAYRSIGQGTPLVLCVRLRGVLDVWDPAFLDALATSFRVIIFDYSGFGRSSGTPSYNSASLARDAIDLADALGLETFVIGGWSLGGRGAQVVAALHPARVSHLVLIGTIPPGKVMHGPEPIFFERALKPVNDLADEEVLFFEPLSATSRAAAKASHDRIAQRTTDLSPVIPEEMFTRLLAETRSEDQFHVDDRYRDALTSNGTPLLGISGDHEIVFPVENWFALNRKWPSLRLFVLPQAGHAPHHQYPQVCVDLITSFVLNSQAGSQTPERGAS